jgi:hypothetical protein
MSKNASQLTVTRVEIGIPAGVLLTTSDVRGICDLLRNGPLNRYEAAHVGEVAWPAQTYVGDTLVIECKTGSTSDKAAMANRSGLRR